MPSPSEPLIQPVPATTSEEPTPEASSLPPSSSDSPPEKKRKLLLSAEEQLSAAMKRKKQQAEDKQTTANKKYMKGRDYAEIEQKRVEEEFQAKKEQKSEMFLASMEKRKIVKR